MSPHLENSRGPVQLVLAFNEALNAQNIDKMLLCMTPDCIFENTYSPPDGMRYEGHAAIRSFWLDFFKNSNQATITIEEIFALYDRCVMLWNYRWIDPQGQHGHVRGVDVYRLRDGLIAEKLSYVKG